MTDSEKNLKTALLECLIPLEAINMTMMDSDSLCVEMKEQIIKSIKMARLAVFDITVNTVIDKHEVFWNELYK